MCSLMLPRNVIVTMLPETFGVNSANITNFVDSVRDLTSNNQKVLFIHDGYRSHMGVLFLHLHDKNNIIVYALPSHTLGKTQPLDVSVFGTSMIDVARSAAEVLIDTFDFMACYAQHSTQHSREQI